MRTPLAPIQACVREPAAQRSSCLQVNAERLKCLGSGEGEIVRIIAARREPTQRLETVVKRDAQCAGHVVVASPRGEQTAGRVWPKLVPRAARQAAPPFPRTAPVAPFHTVVPTL